MPENKNLLEGRSKKRYPKNINFKEVNKEVYYAIGNIIKLRERDIQLFKEKAIHNKRQRSRLCTHKDINDKLHEMFIVHRKDTYVRPHKHLHKSESLHVIEGSAYMIVFDELGKILEVTYISDYPSGHRFYYRMDKPFYHTLLITSDFFVFHETTNGPFNRSETVFAEWAPDEVNVNDQKICIDELTKKVKSFLSKQNGVLKC